MKRILLVIFLISSISAKDKEALLQEKKALNYKLALAKIKLIKEDKELQKIHQEILDLHLEMAKKLNKYKQIEELNNKIKAINNQLKK